MVDSTVQISAPAVRVSARAVYWALALLLAGLFLWLNLRICMSIPPWIDEVMQVDAGVNLYLGKGWVSTAWPQQSQFEFWAANNPLYTLLVYCWVSVWGFSPAVVRSLNLVLILVICGLLVDAARRSQLLQSAWARFALAAILLFNQAVAFVYSSGRADLVTMLAVTLLIWVYLSVHETARRRRLLFGCSTLLLPAGLHTIPFTALLLCLDFGLRRKLKLSDLKGIALGCLGGGLLMAAIFLRMGSLKAYIVQTFASSYNILGSALIAAVVRDSAAVGRFVGQLKDLSPLSVAAIIAKDVSSLPLFLFLLSLLFFSRKHSALRLAALFGLISAVFIPYGMLAAGRYAFYYAWMGSLPLIFAFARCLELLWIERRRSLVVAGICTGLLAVCLGAPPELLRLRDTPADYSVVQSALRRDVQPGEHIFADPVLYYAAQSAGVPFISTTYATGRQYPRMSDSERAAISVIAVRRDQLPEAVKKLGGAWTWQDTYQTPYGFPLVFCRRATPPLTTSAPLPGSPQNTPK